jgi:uncharacterized Tic20 family protein
MSELPPEPELPPTTPTTPPPPPPPPPAPPVGEAPLSDGDARMWAMLAHIGGFVIAIIAPLVILLTMGKRSPLVDDQAKEALNFQITAAVALLISALLVIVLIGIVIFPIVGIATVIFTLIGGIKAYNGEYYRYPVNVRIIK